MNVYERALLDISDVDQIMINIHSSVLVVDEHPQQKIFRVEKEDRKTSITPVGVMDKMAIALYQSGKSFVTVAKELKVNPETIRQAFIKRGVKIRGAHKIRNQSSS